MERKVEKKAYSARIITNVPELIPVSPESGSTVKASFTTIEIRTVNWFRAGTADILKTRKALQILKELFAEPAGTENPITDIILSVPTCASALTYLSETMIAHSEKQY